MCLIEFCNNNVLFFIFDNDNDGLLIVNNVVKWCGVWWYYDGYMFNFNGEYGNINYGKGVIWIFYKGWIVLLFGVRMMFCLN